jgi:hypothetical protein
VYRLLANDPLTSDYVVNVLNPGSPGVAYGYAISQNRRDDIVACTGRKQPRARYMIDIKFKPAGINTAKSGYLLGSLPFLAFVGFLFFRSAGPRKTLPGNGHDTGMITLGSALFDAKNRKLIIDGTTIDLTGTESRVLRIFALSPNETLSVAGCKKRYGKMTVLL